MNAVLNRGRHENGQYCVKTYEIISTVRNHTVLAIRLHWHFRSGYKMKTMLKTLWLENGLNRFSLNGWKRNNFILFRENFAPLFESWVTLFRFHPHAVFEFVFISKRLENLTSVSGGTIPYDLEPLETVQCKRNLSSIMHHRRCW